MRLFSLLTLTLWMSAFLLIPAAQGSALPPGVFQMSDGAYYHPESNFLTLSLEEMRAHVGGEARPLTLDESPLLKAIGRGRELLTTSSSEMRIERSDTGWRVVTLAIWNPTTDAIRRAQILKKGRNVQVQTPGAGNITVARANGINSEYLVAHEVVVAVRYPIYIERKGARKKRLFEVREAVYTPYSRALHTPQMVAEGQRWFRAVIAGVFDQLRADGIPSRAFPSQLLADTIDPRFVESIALIEHLDDAALAQNPIRQIESFYVTLAANRETAYNFSKSKSGALGLVQFIPKTYTSLTTWPRLALEKNFEKGMRDPANAIKAQIAYLDHLLSRLPGEARVLYATSRDRSHEYIAAAYNGGATRVARAMVVWEDQFDAQQRNRLRAKARLRRETVQYVLKLRTARDLTRIE